MKAAEAAFFIWTYGHSLIVAMQHCLQTGFSHHAAMHELLILKGEPYDHRS